MKKSVLLLLIGPPGSGKSYFAQRYSREHHFVHINSDQVRTQYFPHPTFTTEERGRVYDRLFELAEAEVHAGRNVVVDGNLETNAERRAVLNRFAPYARVFFAIMETPRQVALERAIHREYSNGNMYHPLALERAEEMHREYELLDSALPHVMLKGEASYEENERIVDNELE